MAVSAEEWDENTGLAVIREREVHVWRARLDWPADQLRELERFLQDDELERARRFRFAVHRSRFVSRRGVLRVLLSRYLRTPPEDIDFEYAQQGKPSLAKHHGSNIRFNSSHSHDLALFVLTDGREAGIDVERIQPDFRDHSIPERFFAPGEAAMLRALPLRQQPKAFFELWVRKEAYVKARGLGLSLALDSFEVPLADDAPVRPSNPMAGADIGRWMMRGLHPAPDYAAALVVEGHAFIPHCWNWSLAHSTDTETQRP